MSDAPALNDDFRDLLAALLEEKVQFVVVGAYALSAHGLVRATSDIDILVVPEAKNAQRVHAALQKFGAPLHAHGVQAQDFCQPGTVYQIGLPPRRIDILTHIDGVSSEEARRGALEVNWADLRVPVLGRAELLRNKRATGRDKDALDVAWLEGRGGGHNAKSKP